MPRFITSGFEAMIQNPDGVRHEPDGNSSGDPMGSNGGKVFV
jgi:hypothetical protein